MHFSSLDTPSGHIVCGFLLLVLGAVFFKLQIPIANELMTVGIAAITISMKGLNGGTVTPPTTSTKPDSPKQP